MSDLATTLVTKHCSHRIVCLKVIWIQQINAPHTSPSHTPNPKKKTPNMGQCMSAPSAIFIRCDGKSCASCRWYDPIPSALIAISASHPPFQYTRIDSTGSITISEQRPTAPVLCKGIRSLFDPRDASIYPVRADALQRWHTWIRRLSPKIDARSFDLVYVFRIFDDYFFCSGLRHRVRVDWVDKFPDEFKGVYGRTIPPGRDPAHPHNVHIEIRKLESWNEVTIRFMLSVLIHEMGHAVFMLFECQCGQCWCQVRKHWGSGITGHGNEWKELARAMETELRRSFTGFHQEWKVPGWRSGDFSGLSEEQEFRRVTGT